MTTVKYRSINPNLRPRRTRLDVPGWAGQNEPRANGTHEYPWHCIPFSEAARAGLECTFPYEDDPPAPTCEAIPFSAGEFGDARNRRPPFRSFGADYYTYQIL